MILAQLFHLAIVLDQAGKSAPPAHWLGFTWVTDQQPEMSFYWKSEKIICLNQQFKHYKSHLNLTILLFYNLSIYHLAAMVMFKQFLPFTF